MQLKKLRKRWFRRLYTKGEGEGGFGGFIGGPIFPLFFAGGTMGTVVAMLFPDIPVALAVGCLMVAVTAGILPIPISLGVYVILIVGLPITEAIPVLIAALTSFLVIKGFGLVPAAKKPNTKRIDKDKQNASPAG